MRNAFVDGLVALADRDERVVLLTGDLGYAALEPFAERFPKRFWNVGVAEQNMVGLATGLAEAGFVPFAYSISAFAAMRPYEFIRNGPVNHRFPVRIVGMGGGFDYGNNGISHYALEDVALMRAQPSLAVLAPADSDQARAVVAATADLPGPVYIRLGRRAEPVPGLDGSFEFGRVAVIGDGRDVAILALGSMAGEAVRAADLLGESGIDAAVVVAASVNPAPVADFVELLERMPLAVTVEAHYRNGGLGSLVAEVIADAGLRCKLLRLAVDDEPVGVSGSERYLLERFGLTAEQIAAAVVARLAAGAPGQPA